MNLEETIAAIAEEESRVMSLERQYESEEDGHKAELLWRKMERAQSRLDKLIDEADALRAKKDKEKEEIGMHVEDPSRDKPDEDEDVCPECGSDLLELEDGVLYCEECKEYYERE